MTNDNEFDDRSRRITARHAGRCAECLAAIEPGDEVVWEPARGTRPAKTYCDACGADVLDA